MRQINEIIIHATATRPEWWATRTANQKVAEVRRWHVEQNGWKDIGYHYLIDRDGKVVAGRPLEQVGAHVQGRNTGTIGIALFGGHGSAATDRFDQHYTPAQDAALRRLIADLTAAHGPLIVSGHNQYAAKACPGFDARAWFGGSWAPGIAPPVESGSTPTSVGLLAAIRALLARLFGRSK